MTNGYGGESDFGLRNRAWWAASGIPSTVKCKSKDGLTWLWTDPATGEERTTTTTTKPPGFDMAKMQEGILRAGHAT